jgi:hypothetical protein
MSQEAVAMHRTIPKAKFNTLTMADQGDSSIFH